MSKLTYRDAGVNIDNGNELVRRIKEPARRTSRPEVVGGLGGFAALTKIPAGYREPVLVSGTDGVGTKLRLAIDLNRHSTVGQDLVAMCVNDLLVCGAEPLLFLDYYATASLNVDTAAEVITGIARGCEMAGCALVGGETAEMPGMYAGGDYDLAGFSVGVVEASSVIDGKKVRPGDVLVGVRSSGPHSNGFSLIRHILKLSHTDLHTNPLLPSGQPLADALLAPTIIYVKPVLRLLKQCEVHAMSHITGGGFLENLPRVFPDNAKAVIDSASWEWPEVFGWLAEKGGIEFREMCRTFNCGIGLILIMPKEQSDTAISLLAQEGLKAGIIGSIQPRSADEEQVLLTR